MSTLAPISLLMALADICLAGAIVGCVFTMIETVFVLGFGGGSLRRPDTEPPVSVLKPLHGCEPDLVARLAQFCDQDYGAPVQVVLGARQEDDDALGAAQAVKDVRPQTTIELAVDGRARGSNRKVSNLINMLLLSRYDILVLSDSDIVVRRDYLRNIAALLASPRVGAVTCLYYGLGEGLWQRLSALAINSHFLPQAITAAGLGLARHCCGATIALRRSMLDRIGGFAAFADVLADDYAIGAAVRSLGCDIATAPFLVGHRCFEDSLRRLFLHQMRVARTIRSIEPMGYAGTVITHPWPLALIGLMSASRAAALVAAAALTSRLALCWCVERRFGLPKQSYWLIPLQDIIAFAVFLASFFGTKVHWRGSDYHVSADGALIEDNAGRDLSVS